MTAIVLVGLSHRTARLDVRERAALTDAGARAVLRELRGLVGEALVLSTCNRTEVLAVASTPATGEAALRAALLRHTEVGAAALACCGYARFELDAVEHLFRVAAGLESAVLGETEIAGQLRQAAARAEEEGTLGPVLTAACRRALDAGRRVRERTSVARGATSTASLVARLVGPAPRRVLLVGAGRMIAAVAGALGGHELVFANRTTAAARPLADRHGGECAGLERLGELVEWADFVVTATGAPHPILTAARLAGAGPLTIVDLAVPRDVEPAAAALPGFELHDVDALHARLEEGRALRSAQAERAGAIVAAEVQRFADWRRARRVEPALAALWREAERLRREEVERLGRKLSPADRAALDAASAALVRRLLDGPARRLRERGGEPDAQVLLELLEATPRALRSVAA